MFETPETKKETSGAGVWVGILIAAVVVVGGVVLYMDKGGAKSAAPAAISAAPAATPQSNADAVKDLHVANAKMDKDPTGNVAVWSVDIKNQSSTFTYSAIAYQTTYVGADSNVLAQNHGTIPLTLGPGESESTQFRDVLLPSGTALYRFNVTGASAQK